MEKFASPQVDLISYWDGSITAVRHSGGQIRTDTFNYDSSSDPRQTGTQVRTVSVAAHNNTVVLVSSSNTSPTAVWRIFTGSDTPTLEVWSSSSTVLNLTSIILEYHKPTGMMLLANDNELKISSFTIKPTQLQKTTLSPRDLYQTCSVYLAFAGAGPIEQDLHETLRQLGCKVTGVTKQLNSPDTYTSTGCSQLATLGDCLGRFECMGVATHKNVSCFALPQPYLEKIFTEETVRPVYGVGRSFFEYLSVKYKTARQVLSIIAESAGTQHPDASKDSGSDTEEDNKTDDEGETSLNLSKLPDEGKVFYNNTKGLSIQTQVMNKPRRA